MSVEFDANALKVARTLRRMGFKAWFVGGCARDSLLNLPFADYDIATSAKPDEIVSALSSFAPDPTFKNYGCVKLSFGDVRVEITTLRKDVSTFGRQAIVEFTDDVRLDAERRDFTVNALYWDGAFERHDFFNGMDDLKNERIRFIGDPFKRVREDYLRISRFLRFSAGYAENIDPEGMRACVALQENLRYLSGKRVWEEWKKLLKGKNSHKVLEATNESGIARTLFGVDLKLDPLKRFKGKNPLLAFGLSVPNMDLKHMESRLRLDSREAALARFAFALKENEDFKKIYFWRKNDALELLYFWAAKFDKDENEILGQDFWRTLDPVFPLTGNDLAKMGFAPGVALGESLRATRDWWIANDFKPNREECLDYAEKFFTSRG